MANSFKNKKVDLTTTDLTTLYTVPSATTTVVIGITLANVSGAGAVVGVGITRPTADDVKVLKNVAVPQGSTLEFMGGNKVVLETADTLTVNSDANNSIDAALTIMEIT